MRLAVLLYFWLISTQGDTGPVGPQGLMGIPGIGSQGEQVIDAFSLSLSCRTFWPKPGVHWRPVRQTAISTLDSGVAVVLVQRVKRLSTVQETWVPSLGREDSLEKEMATHSSTLAWKIPWMEEPGAGYCPWGHKESDTTERLHFHFHPNGYVGRDKIVPQDSSFENLQRLKK